MRQKTVGNPISYHLIRLGLLLTVISMLLLFTTFGQIGAQGSVTLVSGGSVTGTINDQTHIALYTFSGKAGDLISLQAIGTTPGMNPTLSLLAPSQQQLASNASDPNSPVGLDGARVSYLLPQDGMYSVLVGGTNGDFLLRFGSRPSRPAIPLAPNVPIVATLVTGAGPQLYSLTTNPGGGVSFTFSTGPGFSYDAQIFDGTGQLVAMLGGPASQAEALTLCGNSGVYEVLVSSAVPNTQGAVTILPGSDAAGMCGQNAAAVPTIVPIVGSTGQPSANVCSATSIQDGAVNLRSGPSAFFNIIGQLAPHGSIIINGRSSDQSWYVSTDSSGRNVWIAAFLVTLSGPCNSLTMMQSGPPPFTLTPIPTQTPIIIIVTPTFTFTPNPSRTRRPTQTPFVVTATQLPATMAATP